MINVLFLCIGNSCRSQMAEGFARVYGSDVMRPFSAGLSPAQIVQPLTKKVMLEKNISLEEHYPKDLAQLETQDFSLIVNMSGNPLPIRSETELRVWRVADPMGQTEEAYIKVRDQLEGLVMQLILELRRRARSTSTYSIPKKLPAELKATRIGFGRMRIPRD